MKDSIKALAVDFLKLATLNKQDFMRNMSVFDANSFGSTFALSYFILQISYYGP